MLLSNQQTQHRLSFFLKVVVDFLGHKNDPIYCQSLASKICLLTREQWVDDEFDTGIDKSFEDLVRDARQRDETMAFGKL